MPNIRTHLQMSPRQRPQAWPDRTTRPVARVRVRRAAPGPGAPPRRAPSSVAGQRRHRLSAIPRNGECEPALPLCAAWACEAARIVINPHFAVVHLVKALCAALIFALHSSYLSVLQATLLFWCGQVCLAMCSCKGPCRSAPRPRSANERENGAQLFPCSVPCAAPPPLRAAGRRTRPATPRLRLALATALRRRGCGGHQRALRCSRHFARRSGP